MSRRFLAVAAALVAVAAAPAPATAEGAGPYTLHAQALLGGGETDLYLTITGPAGFTFEGLEKAQVKELPFGADSLRTRNYFELDARDGVVHVSLGALERHQPLHVLAQLKNGPTYNLEAETIVELRPDLTVAPFAVPDPIVRRHPFTIAAAVREIGGDTGAVAVVKLLDGSTLLASQLVTVGPGGQAEVSLIGALERPPQHDLTVSVSDSSPAEDDVSNNAATRSVRIWLFPTDVVVTDNAEATQAGAEILNSGGNAFDAAAAVLFALNVTEPNVAGIGGSSNIVIVRPDGEQFAIDAREVAPAATTSTTYAGQSLVNVSLRGYSVGVPTNLIAVDTMLRRWGTMSLAQTLQPAIALADNAPARWFLTDRYGCLDSRVPQFVSSAAIKALCLDASDGTFTQPALASTFRLLAEQGVDAFYRGPIAQAIVDAVKSTPVGPGLMELSDLETANVVVEQPVRLTYHDAYTVLGAPPSTAGGIVTLETLGLLDRFPLGQSTDWAFGQVKPIHVTLEAMRLAFADRDWWIGDGAAAQDDAVKLLNTTYLAARGAPIDPEKRIPEPTLPGDPRGYPSDASVDESSHTTHISIIDRFGNAIAMTTTMGNSFGSGIVVPGYGFALNDSLDLFNLNPLAVPGGNPGANDAAGGKRPRGHMSPTIVLKNGEPVVLTGTYGSAFIPSLVLNVLTNVMDYGMTLREAVDAPRIWGSASTGVSTFGLRFGPSTSLPLRLDQGVVDYLKDVLGDRISRRPDPFPQFGALETAGVDPVTLEPIAAADVGRMPGAAGIVVPR